MAAAPRDPSAVPSLPGRPDHPDADALAAAMRRVDAFAEGRSSDPMDAVRTWAPLDLVVREAQAVTRARHGEAQPDAHDRAAGTTAFVFGFTVACSFSQPDAPLGRRPNPGFMKDDDPAAETLAVLAATPQMITARNTLARTMSAAVDVESWQRTVANFIDPETLQWAATQTTLRLNNVETVADLRRLQMLDRQDWLREAVGMFIDGFLLAMHYLRR